MKIGTDGFPGKAVVLLGALAVLTGCGGGGSSSESSPSDFDAPVEPVNIGGDGDIFDPERLLDVEITMSASNWRTLKAEARTLADTSRECLPEFEYTELPATVTIDGDTMGNVNVRKKGFIGSLSPDLPSLKLDFNDLQEGRTYQNVSRMTLNNNRQDPSNVRQCLAYDRFRDIGIAAPLCNYAQVTVNGEDLGVFAHVEPIRKPFLRRTFGDDSGNLYEAQQADFGNYLIRRFETKTNEDANNRSDLQAVADAMALDDEAMMDVLPQLLDVDEFIRFWAMETLLGAWDSASGNANNFYLYHSPDDGLFHFIPWGADTAFRGTHPLKPGSAPLYRNFRLAERLYGMPEYRQQYLDALEDLLANHWDEEAMQLEIERVMVLTGTTEADVESVESFLLGTGMPGDDGYERSQREVLLSAIAGNEPEEAVTLLEDTQPDCSEPAKTNLTASVSAVSGTDSGVFSFTLPDGRQVSASLTFAAFEVDSLVYSVDTEQAPAVHSLLLIGVDAAQGFKPYVLQVFIEDTDYRPGTHKLHGFATNALLFEVGESVPGDVVSLALGATGTITLNSVGSGANAGDVDMDIDMTMEYLPGTE